MRDFLGNEFEVDATVIIAVKSGKYATLGRGYVKTYERKPQFRDGLATDMVEIEWSNLHRFWIPASKVLAVPDSMLPEKRREKLNETPEAVQPS